MLAEKLRMGDAEIPNIYQNRGVYARWVARNDPDCVQYDKNGLAWVKNIDDGYWYSFSNNYSEDSPLEKELRAEKKRLKIRDNALTAIEMYKNTLYQSEIRQIVLDRDKNTCQVCGKQKTSKLHVHHILKRVEGGTDHIDNLVTVCASCHRKADTVLYDLDWDVKPEDIDLDTYEVEVSLDNLGYVYNSYGKDRIEYFKDPKQKEEFNNTYYKNQKEKIRGIGEDQH